MPSTYATVLYAVAPVVPDAPEIDSPSKFTFARDPLPGEMRWLIQDEIRAIDERAKDPEDY